MTNTREVRSTGPNASAGNERLRILVLAGLVVVGVGLYLFVRGGDTSTDSQKNLLPYQVLARTLTDTEQRTHTSLRQGLLAAEADRARLTQWPDAAVLADHGVAPFDGTGGPRLGWQQFSRGTVTNYVGIPADGAEPAWMLAIQEPAPNTPPDLSPDDDEHHRLPDGTTLHIYFWMHRFGGRVAPAFVAQPQSEGWMQVFNAPPNPLFPVRP